MVLALLPGRIPVHRLGKLSDDIGVQGGEVPPIVIRLRHSVQRHLGAVAAAWYDYDYEINQSINQSVNF